MTGEEEKKLRRPTKASRKDRLIQARVPRDLETTLKEEARRRRLTVSHLIRNVLEDTFELVDGVVTNAEEIVNDSVRLAQSVRRSAERMTSVARNDPPPPPADEDDLSDIYAWNEVVLHRPASCSRCEAEIASGERGFTGLSDDASRPRAWLCPRCIEEL